MAWNPPFQVFFALISAYNYKILTCHPEEPSLDLSLRGARKGDEAIFLLRRLLRPCGARNDIWVFVIPRNPSAQ